MKKNKGNVDVDVEILRYQESKRVCCARTVSPPSTSISNQQEDNRYQSAIRKPKENCDLRRCQYNKSQAENEYCNTQKLLDKIQHLKKSIQDLEATQKCGVQKSYRRRDAPSQTQDVTVTDLNSARDAISNCVSEMTKLKEFLDDDNCWWRIFKKREFTCCGQSSPHLHGYLDGTMVTLRMLEETLDLTNNLETSTPVKSNSLEFLNSKKEPEPKAKYTEKDTNTPGGEMKKYVDSSVDPHRCFELDNSKVPDSCQKNCPLTCTQKRQNLPTPESSKETKDEGTGDRSQVHSEAKQETPRVSVPKASVQFPSGPFYAKSSVDLGARSKPRYTFSSENTANRRILAVDISTSMDILADTLHNNVADATTGLNTITERSFSLNPSKMFTKNRSSRSKN